MDTQPNWMNLPAAEADHVLARLERAVPGTGTTLLGADRSDNVEPNVPRDVIAMTDSLEGIVRACVARRHALRIPQTELDDITGLPGGYVAKLEVGIKGLGKLSLPLMLGALGLRLAVVRDVPNVERQEQAA